MQISSIRFHNFRVLRDATLPLGHTTLIVGPNGSGKTTALQALKYLATPGNRASQLPGLVSLRSIEAEPGEDVSLEVTWDEPGKVSGISSQGANPPHVGFKPTGDARLLDRLHGARVFTLQHERIAAPVRLTPNPELDESGAGLAAVLTDLQDHFPERFEALNRDLAQWIPEFDRVLLDTPQEGTRAFMLRTRAGAHRIHATSVSQGSLFALALLTIAHLPTAPCIVAFEDPERGMHPRLLRDVLDAIERLANPAAFEDPRTPVQVLITSHSPYLVDLFRDRLSDVVILEKSGLSSHFQRLSDIPDIEEILNGAHLGEAWFSGCLGGAPAHA